MNLNIFKKLALYLLFTISFLIMLNMNYLHAQTVDVCDNGGFEQDFLYYSGETATFRYGSNDCNPLESDTLTPVTFSSASLPLSRRFEIVSSGIDSLVGIQKTKFGSKALRLNSRFGHLSDCSGNRGVDRIIKEFIVTEDTRNFTVWYALVLENPSGHDNFQPFFNIDCDLAPDDELCFDAAILNCEQEQMDTICNYDSLDVLNWTCHRFRIPKSEIGNIATLEITVSDCGAGAHFGYAYIDGICEDCDSSALGSISLDSIPYVCDSDTLRICGNYMLPDLCNKDWEIKELTVPGYTITGLVIDSINHSFCFDFPKSNFGSDTCLEVYAKGIFTDGSNDLPFVTSNSVNICTKDTIAYDVTIGACDDNGTPTNLSDDYYYVSYDFSNTNKFSWTIERKLDNPYPDENDTHTIATGTDDASGTLGAFLIQEGSWTMIITFDGDCVYEINITPPDYCGDCTEFNDMTISNISRDCSNGAPGTWSFDLYVPGPVGGTYNVIGTGGGINKSFNTTVSISGLSILPSCIKYTLVDRNPLNSCESDFTVCPPKPCKTPSCDLEVYVKDVPCIKNANTGVVTYTVELEVSGGGNLCYSVNGGAPTTLPTNQIIGPYTADIEVVISSCSSSTCSASNCADCWKVIYVPKPECNQTQGLISGTALDERIRASKLKVYPNPIRSDEFLIRSSLPQTQFILLDAYGHIVLKDTFTEEEKSYSLSYPPGLYFLRYKTGDHKHHIIKIIKL